MNERQTDLSLNQILDLLELGNGPYPKCLLINELGVICRNEEDPDGYGEEYLLSAINNPNAGTRAIAFCCLSLIPGIEERCAEEVSNFKNDTGNQELLPMIEQSLARFKAGLEIEKN
jgi:hypothetical protein